MSRLKPDDFSIWSEANQFSEAGLTSTATVCDRLELYGQPYREPSVPRHRPQLATCYGEMASSVQLSPKAMKALSSPALSRRELRKRRKLDQLHMTLAERCLRQLHFASEINEPFDRKAWSERYPQRFAVTQ